MTHKGYTEVKPLYWEKDTSNGNVSFIDNRNGRVSQGSYNKAAMVAMHEHIVGQLSFTKYAKKQTPQQRKKALEDTYDEEMTAADTKPPTSPSK